MDKPAAAVGLIDTISVYMSADYTEKRKTRLPAGLYFNRLMLRAQAPGAKGKMLCLAIDVDSSRVDIRRPAAVGVALGVADITTILR